LFKSGLNDFIKDIVINPKNEGAEDEQTEVEKEDLSGALVIWSERNQYRYRAHSIYYAYLVKC